MALAKHAVMKWQELLNNLLYLLFEFPIFALYEQERLSMADLCNKLEYGAIWIFV